MDYFTGAGFNYLHKVPNMLHQQYCYIIESFIIIRFSSRVFPVGKNDYYDGGFILIFSGLQTANNILRNVMYKISTIGCPFFDDDKFSHETGKQVMLAEIPGEV